MKKISYLSAVLTIIIIWYVIYTTISEPLIMPSLMQVIQALSDILTLDGMSIIIKSLMRLCVAFLVSASLGVLLGSVSAKFKWFKHYQQPFVAILRTIPVISVIVIFFVLFGANISVYIIVFLMLFPLFYQQTLHSFESMDRDLVDVLKLNESHFIESIKYVYAPILFQSLKVTFLQAIGLGIKVLVMAEYLMQTKDSIGKQLYIAKINLTYDLVYAWTFILIALTIVIEILILKINKKTTIS